jgi:hypothetical protein
MKKLLLLAVVGAALGGAEFGSKAYAEAQIAEVIEDRTPGQQDPSVDIDSFPFLGRLLVSGAVGDISVRAHTVRAGPVEFDNLELELEGVRVDRDLLLQRQVKLREIDAGVVRLYLERPLPVEGRVPIPRTALTPCEGELVSSGEGGAVVSCEFDTVPQLFVDAANVRS